MEIYILIIMILLFMEKSYLLLFYSMNPAKNMRKKKDFYLFINNSIILLELSSKAQCYKWVVILWPWELGETMQHNSQTSKSNRFDGAKSTIQSTDKMGLITIHSRWFQIR
jgi:hypothetical protein